MSTRRTIVAALLLMGVTYACNRNPGTAPGDEKPKAGGGSVADRAQDGDGRAITATGCLQKGTGRTNYILTQLNEPPAAAGTAGGREFNDVRTDQRAAAALAYRLESSWELITANMVGKRVRVTGRVTDGADVDKPLPPSDSTPSIKQRDLAAIEVLSVSVVSDSCS
jgi:hypothetical protein